MDSKDSRDKPFTTDAPKIDDFLSGEAQDFFGKVTSGLDAAGVEWTRAPTLVRGLDYYRHTAFEFVTDRLGAQGTVLGGGRYDGLIETLGGPHTPAVGWAAGIERLAMLVADAGQTTESTVEVAVVIEQLGTEGFATWLASTLRRAEISCEVYASGSPRKRFAKAQKDNAQWIVVPGIPTNGPHSAATVRLVPNKPLGISDMPSRVDQIIQSRYFVDHSDGVVAGQWLSLTERSHQ